MLKQILIVLSLSASVAVAQVSVPSPAAATTGASEASIKQLLVVTEVQKVLDGMAGQMDSMMKNVVQQASQGEPVSAKAQKSIDTCRAEVMALFKEELDWKKMEPLYVRVYQQSFNQQEIDGLLAFYKTPTGQALIKKMPLVMQNANIEMQKRMNPMMQKIQQMQQEVITEIRAEKVKKGS